MLSRLMRNILLSLVGLALALLLIPPCFAGSVNYIYDSTNRLIRAEYEDGTATNYIYDSVGNLISRDEVYTFSVTPASHDFGSISVGDTSASSTFTVSNVGRTDLLIHSMTLTGSDSSQFTIQNDTCSGHTFITPNSCTVDVAFSPASEGIKNANLSISFSNPNDHTFDVPLSGTGIGLTTFLITATAGPNGSITPSGNKTVDRGASQTYTMTPNPAFRIADVLVDGVSVGSLSSYTFDNVTASHTIAASFEQIPDAIAPTSHITSPQNSSTLPWNTPVVITGTAADTGGGFVTSVRVSTDGGATWQTATGTVGWSYTWTPTQPGTFIIRSEAVDFSSNVENPLPGVTVLITSDAPDTMWGTTTPQAQTASGNEVELGVKFRTLVDGTITGVRFYKATGDAGTHTAHLWDRNGNLLASGTFTGETSSGWQQVNFTTPVVITANTTYIASYHTNTFVYTEGYFAMEADNGALRYLVDGVDGGNGVFSYGPNFFPVNTNNSTNYWVDIAFMRGTPLPSVIPNNTLLFSRPVSVLIDTLPNGSPLFNTVSVAWPPIVSNSITVSPPVCVSIENN